VGDHPLEQNKTNSRVTGGDHSFQLLQALDNRTVNKNGELIHQVLVQWHNKSPKEATWEDHSDFTIRFPDFIL